MITKEDLLAYREEKLSRLTSIADLQQKELVDVDEKVKTYREELIKAINSKYKEEVSSLNSSLELLDTLISKCEDDSREEGGAL